MADTDYIGFTYNGVHSSELGIVRVSDGSRYNEDLLPSSQDKTVQVPGGDGTYFFGSNFTQRQFNVSYAFDSLTEQQLNRIKFLFGDKKVHELVFDELPYKTYYAKVSGQANIKHIAFSEGVNNRVYKGEGTVSFVCYNPYARCFKKNLYEYRKFRYILIEKEDYEPNKYYTLSTEGIYVKATGEYDSNVDYYEDYSNTREWEKASGLQENTDHLDLSNNGVINIYNPGDKSADFILTLKFGTDGKIYSGSINLTGHASALELCEFQAQGSDTYVKINTKINLIEGYTKTGETWNKTGNIYNQYIESGDFFKIPVTVDKFTSEINQNTAELTLSEKEGANSIQDNFISLEYDYYYL